MPPSDAVRKAEAALRAGRYDEADRECQVALASAPNDADAWRVVGHAHRARGQRPEAAVCWRRSAELRSDPEVELEIGAVSNELGRFGEAAVFLRRVVAQRPGWFEALTQLGIACASSGQLPEAVRAFEAAVRARPDNPQAHHNVGVALVQVGRPEEGIASLRQALALEPVYPDAHYNLGNALAGIGRRAEALDQYRQALTHRPNYVEALNNLGLGLAEAGRPDEAVPYLRQAIRLRPALAEGHNNLGIALDALGQWGEAEAALHEALRLDPHAADAHANLGNVQKARGRLAEALVCYEFALRLAPESVSTRYNRALALLQAGDYERGWPEYEWRLRRDTGPPRCPSARPAWDGSSAGGRTILTWAEQGLGDTIQFVRFAPLLRERGFRVLVHTPVPLLGLFRSLRGVDGLVVEGEPLPPHDVQCPLMSLPYRLGTSATIPFGVPYIAADPASVEKFRPRLAEVPGLKVGLYWQGNPHHPWDRHRSLPLYELEPLARINGVSLVSLQQGPGREQAVTANRFMAVRDLGQDFEMIDDLAGVIAQLDLVVTVDTAAAHLSAALARPTWVLLSEMTDWRWLLGRPDTPWYPTMRLLRRERLGSWKAVVAEARERLMSLVTE